VNLSGVHSVSRFDQETGGAGIKPPDSFRPQKKREHNFDPCKMKFLGDRATPRQERCRALRNTASNLHCRGSRVTRIGTGLGEYLEPRWHKAAPVNANGLTFRARSVKLGALQVR
jgi:hypothetical protein